MTKPQEYVVKATGPRTVDLSEPMTKPPLNTYIEWDGSETPPVPVGTDVTLWFKETDYSKQTLRTSGQITVWHKVTAYLVHAYPPEDEVVECWLESDADGILCYDKCLRPEDGITARAHIRCVNGVFEIVSQEKA